MPFFKAGPPDGMKPPLYRLRLEEMKRGASGTVNLNSCSLSASMFLVEMKGDFELMISQDINFLNQIIIEKSMSP